VVVKVKKSLRKALQADKNRRSAGLEPEARLRDGIQAEQRP
jgi:hypothetical protein